MDKAAVTGFYQTIHAALGEGERGPPRLAFHEILTDQNLYSCRFTMSGTHRAAFMGVPATGRPYVRPDEAEDAVRRAEERIRQLEAKLVKPKQKRHKRQ